MPERFSFSPVDKKGIKDGNRALDAAMLLVEVCNEFGIPVAFENPYTSMMWSDPKLQRALKQAHAVECVVSHCAFKAPWRKNTTFMLGNVSNCDTFGLSDGRHRCRGRHGHCSFRRGKHVQLGYAGAGQDPALFAPTVGAAEYPPKLCELLVRSLTSYADCPKVQTTR